MNITSQQGPSRRFFAHEVIQTSAMDCGPATLKSILEGFGIPISYGRLREACQTDVDGTSIDRIEDLAIQLGLQAEQIMIPADHLLLSEAEALPAIVVTRLPNGLTHFVVAWNRVGGLVQIMDPQTGRRWPTRQSFLNELYIHTFPVSAEDWRAWAGTAGLISPLRRRLDDIKIDEKISTSIIEDAIKDPSWRSLATLDAATRWVAALVLAKGIASGPEAAGMIERFYEYALRSPVPVLDQASAGLHLAEQISTDVQIPADYWSVVPERASSDQDMEQTGRLMLRGAVLVRVIGKVADIKPDQEQAPVWEISQPLPPDLQSALTEPAYKPEQEVFQALRKDGLFTPIALSIAALMATLSVLVEAFLLQGLLQAGGEFGLTSQRIWAVLILLLFILVPLLLEFPASASLLRMGRRLETRLRMAFLQKIPRLGDRYFRSRLTSDMTQRAYDLRQLRSLPGLGFNLIRTVFQLTLTTIFVIWLDPISAPLAIAGTVLFVAFSLLTQPIMEERDRSMRTQIGALSRFYLDALLGLVPAKTHSAERSIRRQHEIQVVEWIKSGRGYFNLSTLLQSIGALLYTTFSVLIVVNYISQGGESNEILLLFYWTLSLPTLGQSLALQIQQYPMMRNRLLRLLEPLAAPDEETTWFTEASAPQIPINKDEHPDSVGIRMEDVWVLAGGNVILQDINLTVQPGEHVAVVGPSGAGKSSLVGLFLGWHRPAKGQIYINETLLNGTMVQSLRRQIAWIDPAVQIWNRSLYENLTYGKEVVNRDQISRVIQDADLHEVLDTLPEGMKTPLGESGGLVSGGEGQRVRLARALLQQEVRLVILDEPFRGLDRKKRSQLLQKARQHWMNNTMIFITHDVSETTQFDRVLVIEDGQIVEDDLPQTLINQEGSRYRFYLDAEREIRKDFTERPTWRRIILENGRLRIENHSKQN